MPHPAAVGGEPVHAEIVENHDLAIASELTIYVHAVHAGFQGALDGV
jgi:hypothetical protein